MVKLWTVDAFTSLPFRGNPAAVMIVNDFPSDEYCISISSEMNLSETAFLKSLSSNRYAIRWFTPTTEVKLCGHATLASAHILFSEGLIQESFIVFDSLSGPLKVFRKDLDKYSLDFPLLPVTTTLPLDKFRDIFGASVVNAMVAHEDIIVELNDLKTLREGSFDMTKITEIETRGIILTATGDEEYDFIYRFFAPRFGIHEDPVTGSANCTLADYWRNKLAKESFKAYQASKRGGELEVSIQDSRVLITGFAKTILECHLKVELL